MILSLCIDTLKTRVSVRGYMFFCPCPETNIASIVLGQLFVHVSMVYDIRQKCRIPRILTVNLVSTKQ